MRKGTLVRTRKMSILVSLLCILGLVVTGVSMRSVKTAAKAAQGFCIVLDAGHGGFDPGAIGPGGVCEDGINLAIVKEAQVLLQERGYTVLLTRQDADALGQTKQSDMQQRRRMIMDSGCDLMISVHLNANADASCRGPVVLYRTGDEVSREAAQILQDALNEGLKIEKPRIIQTGEYFILRCTEAPSLIVECGFVSNAQEEALLSDPEYQTQVAQVLVRGVDSAVRLWRERARPTPRNR